MAAALYKNGRLSLPPLLLFVIASALVVSIPVPLRAVEGLQAGAATADITPPTGFPMWGYASRKDTPSVGVLDRLLARALVLAADGKRIALVSVDLGRGPPRAVMQSLRKRVAAAGITQVFIVASHTHHGPVLELDSWPSREKPYVRELEDKLADLILRAAKALKPARIGVAAKEVRLNRNRHSQRPDAPVDRQLLVLRVEDSHGKPIAHAVNFAAHATLHDRAILKFSADYPGVMARKVEKETEAPCLFLQGAAGDLSPQTEGNAGPQGFGEPLAREILTLARKTSCKELARPTLAVRDEDLTYQKRLDLANPFVRMGLERAFFPALIAFYEREYREGVRPHLSVALLDGRIGFVGVSGEFFCGHALSLKRRARLEHLFFLGYCNDYQQYFPTIEAASEGGYGTEPMIAPAQIGAGERVIDRALILLYQMRGQLPVEQKKAP
jgi:hypothetical protein